MQGGNLINLRHRGSGRAGSSAPQGEWEQWPDEAAGMAGQSNEDDDMQRAIAASLADPDQGLRFLLLLLPLLLLLLTSQQLSCLVMLLASLHTSWLITRPVVCI